MRGILLGVVAGIAFFSAGPASAAAAAAPSFFRPAPTGFGQFERAADVRVHRGRDRDRRGGGEWDRDHRGGDHRDRDGDTFFPYREYQGDTLWREGGFNDWWHDRPDRAFPRWLTTNQNCERHYWTGSGWRC